MNKIDELSKELTTSQTIREYTKQGHVGRLQLAKDMETCSVGNRRAIEAFLGLEHKHYQRYEDAPLEEVIKMEELV